MVRDWDRVITLNAGPDQWKWRLNRALALTRGGDYTRATAEAEILEKDAELTNDGRYNLACVYSLALTALGSNPLPATVDSYAVRAFSLLEKILIDGFFQEPGHTKLLASDPDLLALRSREAFRKLLKAPVPQAVPR
ncbi:MAG TPA: hypothetical protein VGP68_15310 [Gemmataceae bacterium]|nr:hypothetical protein [Gemmataceae bacterium]